MGKSIFKNNKIIPIFLLIIVISLWIGISFQEPEREPTQLILPDDNLDEATIDTNFKQEVKVTVGGNEEEEEVNEDGPSFIEDDEQEILSSNIVARVIDGDTIELQSGDRVRLICIDTPERGEYYYNEATEYLESLILNAEVELVKDVSDTDRYDRLLRYVYLNGDFINELIVLNGYGKAYPYSPDTSLCPEIEEAEDYAQSNNLGIWYVEPVDTDTRSDTGTDNNDEEICSCSSDIYNCGDFNTQSEAQACFDYCGPADVHGLDRDDDGDACENL